MDADARGFGPSDERLQVAGGKVAEGVTPVGQALPQLGESPRVRVHILAVPTRYKT